MLLAAIYFLIHPSLADAARVPLGPVQLATFGIPDTLFLVVLALVVFGPKKLPEISRQVGKLLYEFRKASNDFKFQIEEEMRAVEQAERQKELAAQAAKTEPATPVAITAGETVSAEPADQAVRAPEPAPDLAAEQSAGNNEAATTTTPTIQPPSSGLPVSTRSPYRPTENAAEGTAAPPTSDTEAFDEMRADAEEAVRSAAAEPSYTPGGDAEATQPIPTHHG
jgi:sec-independent protein translocase protein TatB